MSSLLPPKSWPILPPADPRCLEGGFRHILEEALLWVLHTRTVLCSLAVCIWRTSMYYTYVYCVSILNISSKFEPTVSSDMSSAIVCGSVCVAKRSIREWCNSLYAWGMSRILGRFLFSHVLHTCFLFQPNKETSAEKPAKQEDEDFKPKVTDTTKVWL